MRTVVEDHVNQVAAFHAGSNSHVAHVHDAGTVAVKAVNPSLRFLQGDAKGNLRSMTHGTHGQEIALVPLVHGSAVFEQFS